MANWWRVTRPALVAAPADNFVPGSVRDPRLLDRESVQPGPDGRLPWDRLTDVLAVLGDLTPMTLYETTAEDITAISGASVRCYFRPEGPALVDSLAPDGWRRFAFASESLVVSRLVMNLATITQGGADRLVACTLNDGHDGVLLSDGKDIVLGDLPAGRGPVRRAVRLRPEDVQPLMLARVSIPAVA